jgi:Holliday junction resolvase RusA-like endonuclease
MSHSPYDLSFFAPGVPAPKGSLDAKPVKGSRKVYMVAGNQAAQDRWASSIRDAARAQLPEGWELWPGRVEVICQFVIPERPRVHRETDLGAGDGDKLDRCVWDAMTGVVYVDDKQVTVWGGSKRMTAPGEMGGVMVHVRLIHDESETESTS